MTHKPSKEATAKKVFSSEYVIGATCLDEYSGIFFLKVCRDFEIFQPPCCCFL